MIGVRDIEVPSTDPVARAATPLFGGPLGRYAPVSYTHLDVYKRQPQHCYV